MRELAAKDGGRKIEDEWLDQLSGGGDKDKKLPSSLPKLNNSKFRNLGKVCCYGNYTLLYNTHLLKHY